MVNRWAVGYHDHELIKGIILHGYGMWQDIEKDEQFSFLSSKENFIESQKNSYIKLKKSIISTCANDNIIK